MGNEQSRNRIVRGAKGGFSGGGPAGGLVMAGIAGIVEMLNSPVDKSSDVIPVLVSHGASSKMKQMVSDKLFYGETEFECKIEQPTYEKVKYNKGYLHYERFRR